MMGVGHEGSNHMNGLISVIKESEAVILIAFLLSHASSSVLVFSVMRSWQQEVAP